MPKVTSTWKAFERELSRFFGSVRNALSGGNSKLTRSDSCHKYLYLEGKWGQKIPAYTLFCDTKEKAQKEGKIPVLCLKKKGMHGFLIMVHSDNLLEVAALKDISK